MVDLITKEDPISDLEVLRKLIMKVSHKYDADRRRLEIVMLESCIALIKLTRGGLHIDGNSPSEDDYWWEPAWGQESGWGCPLGE